MNKEWFKEWFASEEYLDVYSHRNAEDTENLIKLILSEVKITENANILDAACGAGRHSIKLAELGYNVTGFDLSGTLLQIAIKVADERNLNINFVRADLRTYYTETKFDLVVNLFTSFGYFHTDEENFTFASNAFKMLSNGGYYILDYLNKNYLEENLIDKTEKIFDDKQIRESRIITEGRVIKKITITKENENSEFLESVKLYSYDELVSNFEKIGYRKIKVFGDYHGNEFEKESSERCIIIFQK
ncbi:MAG: class I SAM-dependent methyltransferase [Melioribacteraceae bacterium]|nr:class I SAM-dependent methyltransferase [Melioribacteraceae bacterium]